MNLLCAVCTILLDDFPGRCSFSGTEILSNNVLYFSPYRSIDLFTLHTFSLFLSHCFTSTSLIALSLHVLWHIGAVDIFLVLLSFVCEFTLHCSNKFLMLKQNHHIQTLGNSGSIYIHAVVFGSGIVAHLLLLLLLL